MPAERVPLVAKSCVFLFSPEEEEFFSANNLRRHPIFPPDEDKEEVNRKGSSNLPPAQAVLGRKKVARFAMAGEPMFLLPEDAKGTGSLFSRRMEAEESKASDRRLSN